MKYLKGFDGLRAIFILLVLFGHLGLGEKIHDNPFLWGNYNLFSPGAGVMIFFSISGFLITSLLLNEKKSIGGINFKYFFIRRFLRLAPPLLVFLFTVTVLMYFNLIPHVYTAVLISFFYLYDFVPVKYYTSELAHTWSLGVEEQFYLLWPFVISQKKIKTGLIFSAIIILLCLNWEIFYAFSFNYNGKFHVLSDIFFVDRWFIPACLPIMIGSLTSMLLFSKKLYLQHLLYKNYLFPIAALLLFIAQLYIPHLSTNFINILQPLGVSSFLLWIYFNQDTFLVNLLELKPISFLGKISYGVYVYQGLFLRNGPGGSLAIQRFPLNICLVFITASISYFLIEKKIMKYKKRFNPKRNIGEIQ